MKTPLSATIVALLIFSGFGCTPKQKEEITKQEEEQIKKEIPLATFGKAEDVAGAVAYLVSDDGGYITGQTLHINGGMYM